MCPVSLTTSRTSTGTGAPIRFSVPLANSSTNFSCISKIWKKKVKESSRCGMCLWAFIYPSTFLTVLTWKIRDITARPEKILDQKTRFRKISDLKRPDPGKFQTKMARSGRISYQNSPVREISDQRCPLVLHTLWITALMLMANFLLRLYFLYNTVL